MYASLPDTDASAKPTGPIPTMSSTPPSDPSSRNMPADDAGTDVPSEPGQTPPSGRTRVRRIPEYARYEVATVHAITDAALMCHVAFSDAAGIHCIPTACWRQGAYLYIHGSNGSRMLRALQSGAQAAVTITLLDGLVLARSAFNHAMNYRSLVIYGQFAVVPDTDKPSALAAFLEHILPGRQAMIRPGDANELAATTVLRIRLDEASAKVRTGPPDDNVDDMRWPVWAGVLPLGLLPLAPQRDPLCDLPAPEHVQRWPQRRFDAAAPDDGPAEP
jgi:nitroimidazol reductase NimA-like FMN-containing flavoprotein (pyridoxamine 5'-phosphate oxidase superfamily)